MLYNSQGRSSPREIINSPVLTGLSAGGTHVLWAEMSLRLQKCCCRVAHYEAAVYMTGGQMCKLVESLPNTSTSMVGAYGGRNRVGRNGKGGRQEAEQGREDLGSSTLGSSSHSCPLPYLLCSGIDSRRPIAAIHKVSSSLRKLSDFSQWMQHMLCWCTCTTKEEHGDFCPHVLPGAVAHQNFIWTQRS